MFDGLAKCNKYFRNFDIMITEIIQLISNVIFLRAIADTFITFNGISIRKDLLPINYVILDAENSRLAIFPTLAYLIMGLVIDLSDF